MRIIQFNVWGGRLKGALERFVRENEADIICMQEAVWCETAPEQLSYIFDTVEKLKDAGGYQYDFRTAHFGVEYRNGDILKYGNVIMSKIPFLSTEETFVYGEYTEEMDFVKGTDQIYSAQKVVLDGDIVLLNYHGYWQPDPIGGEMHAKCMRKVADMVRNETRPVILSGDLNISAESPAMRELDFLHDLTAEYDIKQTLQNLKFVKNVACDHILINDKVKARSYQTSDALASDHKAILAELEIIP